MTTKNIGFVVELSGSAEVRSVDDVIRVLNVGDKIHDGDVVTTAISTDILIEFYDGQRLQIGENAKVLLDETVFANLDPFADSQVDQLEQLQQLIVSGIDLAELEAPAAGSAGSESDGLHGTSIYEREGDEGVVDTQVTPFNVGNDELPDQFNLGENLPDSGTGSSGPAASITIDAITADDVINASEMLSTINVTGSVGGDATEGDTVSFTINGTDYSGLVAADLTFSIPVSGSDLTAQNNFIASVEGIDENGNSYIQSTTTSTHGVDTSASASITVNNITPDDVVNIAEAGSMINVTGSVGGDAGPGDSVSFTINGTTYSTTVAGDNTFSIPVNGSDLAAQTSFDTTVTGNDVAGNSFSATTTSTHTVDDEAPNLIAQTFGYDENQAAGAPVASVVAADNIGVTGFSFTATGTNTSNDGYFQIDNSGNITMTALGASSAVNDFESGANTGVYNVTASDAAGNTVSSSISLNEVDIDSTTVSLSADLSTLTEVGGDITYTATLGAVSQGVTTVVTSLGNISILDGNTTGTLVYTVGADEDVYQDTGSVSNAIVNASGGNFELVSIDATPAVTSIVDSIDTTTVSLSANDSVVEGATITYTATLTNLPDGEVTVTLSNGYIITIADGDTTGTVDVTASDDVYSGGDSANASIINATGGNFENLAINGAVATTTINDDNDTVTVNLSGNTVVSEGSNVIYTVTVDTAPETDLTFDVNLTHVDTLSGDISSVPASVTILANETTGFFTINTTDDTVVELGEDYTVSISNPSGGNYENLVIGTSSVTTTIIDTPTITIEDITVDEAAGTATFTVTLSETLGTDVTFDYATSDVTATSGQDYSSITNSGVISAGDTSTAIAVSVNNDAYLESSETFTVTLSNSSPNVVIADTVGIGTISDNSDLTTLTMGDVTVAEGAGTATISATLDNAPTSAPLVVALSNGGTLTFGIGALTATASFATPADDAYVNGGTVNITASVTSGGSEYESLNVSDTADVTVTETPATVTNLTLSGPSSIIEGDDVTFTVSVDNPAETDLDVEVIVGHVTTDNGDITPVTQTVTILAGTSSIGFTISTIEDLILEANETFSAELSGTASGGNFENLVVNTNPVITSIINDDFAPVIDLDADNSSSTGNDYAVTFIEGSSAVYIADIDISITDVDSTTIENATITVNGVEVGDLLIAGSLPSGITASAYDSVTGVMTLTGSATLADYQDAIRAIQFSNDGSTVATNRSIDVVVSDGTNSSNVATTDISITTIPTVSITDVSVQEPAAGTTTLTFTISVDQTLAVDLDFDYETADISALAGADYVGLSSTVGTITAGNTSTTVTVTVNSDADVFEGDELLALNLTNFNQTVNFDAAAHTIAGGVQGLGTIGANNGAPDAVDDNYFTLPNTALTTGNVFSNDTLVDNADINSFDVTSANGGTVSYNNDGTFTYTPTYGFSGTDTFTYTLIDDDGETDTATVTINVNPVAIDPPVVTNLPDSTYVENGSAIDLLSGVDITDLDSSNLSSVVVSIDGYIGSQDVINYLTAGTSVNASTSVTGSTLEITLSGGVDINEYLTVLDSITYENSSNNPSTSIRNITVDAFDESYANIFGTDSGTLSITAVNDEAEVFDNNNFSVSNTQDNPLNIIAPTDVDTDDSSLVITVTSLPVSVGIVTLANGMPVSVNDVLTLDQLTNLQFDAGVPDGEDFFTYSVFDGEFTSVGTTTINVGSSEPEFNTVYESALSGGTEEGSGQHIATGNLFANDAAANASTTVDSVDFNFANYTPDAITGIISINTGLGTLTVYSDNSQAGFSAGDYVYELTSTDNSGLDVSDSFTYHFTSGSAQQDDLTITIVDDVPVANAVVQDIPESEEKIFNLILTLDDSGSMGWGAITGSNPPGSEPTRMEIAKEALSALAGEYFNQSTQVEVTLITFNSSASYVGTYDNYSDFETALTGVTPGGGTNYVDATDEIQSQLLTDLGAQNPADDVQNISYFISDGEANSGTSPIGSGYFEFVNNNSIDSYSVGIGSSLPGDLSDLNYIHNIDSLGRGNGHVDDALIVTDVSELESELLSTVPTAFGGNITANGSVSNVLFGADGGYVETLTTTIGGTDYTFSYDGSTVTVPAALAATVVVNGSTLELGSDDGFAYGTFTFDFSDGSYTLSAPNGLAPSVFNFDYSIIDGDGDTAAATATINIIDDQPDARADLHSLSAFEIAEGNVVTAIGTDGGPKFGSNISPFASQGGGVDKVVDDATVSEFTYKGSSINLALTTSGSIPTGTSEDINLNSQAAIDTSQFTASGSAAISFSGGGLGISGGASGQLNTGELLTINFDLTELPNGVDNLVLTFSDFESGNNDEATVVVYDTAGAILGTVVQSATNNSNEDIDLSAFSGVGSIDISQSSGYEIQVQNISYDPTLPVLDQTGSDNGSNLTWVYSYEIDLDGNPVYQANVTDSNDGSEFIMRSNGFYSFTPDQTGGPVDVSVDTTSQANVDASDLSISIRSGGTNLQYSGDGVGVQGGSGQLLSSGEAMLVTFDSVALPNGVNDLVLTINDFQSVNTDQATVIVTHDTDGDGNLTTDTVVLSASGSGTETLDLSQFTGVTQFDIEYTGGGWDLGLGNVSYQEPATASVTSLEPQMIDYTLTDTDGQSDVARLSLYAIDQTLTGTTGIDNISAGALNDAIVGDAGDDILSGNAGHDTISGGEGDDTLDGGADNDFLTGGDGLDILSGGIGMDHLDGGADADIVDGGADDDVVLGGDGDDLVFGGAGNDRVEGGAGDDTVRGNIGDDILLGNEGEDILIGGAGDDTLVGGAGIDIFALESGDEGVGTPAIDTIADFSVGSGGDVLDLSDMLQGEDIGSLDSYLHFSYDGSDSTISIEPDGSGGVTQQLVLTGVDLTAGGAFITDQDILDNLLGSGNLVIDQ